MAGRLQGKVAIVTGSGGSIGRAAALQFAREGARIVGADVEPASALETVALVRSVGGEIASLQPCDLTSAAGAADLVALALSAFGRVDVLFNNAALAHFAWFEDMSEELFRKTLRDELEIVFHVTKAAWPHLVASGRGAVVNAASVSGMIPYEVLPGLAHSTAKGGVLAMTRHLAMEGAPHNLRANAISPGLVETTQTRALLSEPDWWGRMRAKLMLKRVGQPEDVAAAATFLASDEAGWITGVNLPVDGGTTAW